MEKKKFYHGIIIEQGLKDKNILNENIILGNKKGNSWNLIKVSIASDELQQFVNIVQQNLIEDDEGIPYYAHFYCENNLVVVFPLKIFHVTTISDTWSDVIAYGKSLGIPESQLDFFPAKFSDETF